MKMVLDSQNLRKKEAKPKNYMNENLKKVHQIQKLVRSKTLESQEPPKELWKSKKFQDVPSRFREQSQNEPSAPGNYLRAHSRSGPPTRLPSENQSVDGSFEKLSLTSADDLKETELLRKDVDFVKRNSRAAKHHQQVRPPSSLRELSAKKKTEEDFNKYKKGVIPKYLKERQAQWVKDEEERVASLPDPTVPPGHKVLPDSERVETLELLQKNQRDLLQKIQKLPLSNDSVRAQKRRQELESKLAEIDEAVKIFSRSKVFVKIED
ncbi:enkurin domain-containing protein 1 isoform X2 [Octopus sinensis]|uniref:Enkurin domain-containing protein 1 isoform X2 n=1 Tax=Octopus sinensis TaxID=2607531 RepID=A0A7E6FAB7_9MOLL|nr:enkurin domain-containing protein 1 isoform X2 [Octopus sinensis]